MPECDDISDEEMDLTKNHQVIECPSEPAAEHDNESLADRTWQLLPLVQASHVLSNESECQNDGPMWDPECLVDPKGNETRSIYYKEEAPKPDPSPPSRKTSNCANISVQYSLTVVTKINFFIKKKIIWQHCPLKWLRL